ncbi:uncharacterized protein B4U80_02133 [Leptotrombidium deliense]|uniref:Chitin-binding type-2 domain-containing protein n=1 Tax=Leptotrombidium deliense TaxID=299467 RepID=A0A443SH66_9ACAR|nr:uncharacterized protein B4U80_02133 [Leptotrombidium deliense]
MNPRFVHNDNYEHNAEKRSSFSPLIERNDLPVYRDAPVYSSIITPEHAFNAFPNAVKHVHSHQTATEHHPHHDYFDYGYIPGIPGKPWTDYPLFTHIPYTSFSCKHVAFPGYYADVETGCQVWHYCQLDGRHDKFLCPNGTIFNQETRVCDWWYNVHCPSSPFKFDVNADLYAFRRNYIQIAAPFKSNHYGDSIAKEIPAPPPPPPIAPGIEYIIPPPAIAKGQLLSDHFGRSGSNRVHVHQNGHYYSPNLAYRRAALKDVIFAESRRVQHSTKTKTNSNRFSFSRINASGKRKKVKKFIEPAATTH